MGSIPVAGAIKTRSALAVDLVFVSARIVLLRGNASESGSHLRCRARRACSRAASRRIFAAGEIPVAGAIEKESFHFGAGFRVESKKAQQKYQFTIQLAQFQLFF